MYVGDLCGLTCLGLKPGEFNMFLFLLCSVMCCFCFCCRFFLLHLCFELVCVIVLLILVVSLCQLLPCLVVVGSAMWF